MIIHVEPEALEALAQKLTRGTWTLEGVLSDLQRAVGRLEVAWQGDDAAVFSMEYRRELNRLASAAQELDELAARLRRHATRWQEYEERWAAHYRAFQRGG